MPARTACRERPPMTPSPTAAGHAPSTTPGARILATGEYVENPVAEAFGNVTGLALPATCGTTMPSATTCQRPGVLPVTRCVKATRPEPGRTRRNDAATWKSSPGPRRPVTSRRLPVKRTATWYGFPDSAASNQYVKPMACGVRPASVADPMVTNSSEPVGPGPRPIRARAGTPSARLGRVATSTFPLPMALHPSGRPSIDGTALVTPRDLPARLPQTLARVPSRSGCGPVKVS